MMTMTKNRMLVFAAIMLAGIAVATPGVAQKQYGEGVTEHEIKIGNVAPVTGFMKEYGVIARAEGAYFQMINDRGGVNGRKINFVSVDDGSDTARFVEIVHRLVEQDGVLLIFSPFGTEQNLAIRPYMNEKKVPQLFIQSSSAVFDDPSPFSLDHGIFPRLPHRGLGLREVHPAKQAGRENRHPLREYRCRKGVRARIARWPG
jgi:branched-chain amino acid transport system substrate-binding protein